MIPDSIVFLTRRYISDVVWRQCEPEQKDKLVSLAYRQLYATLIDKVPPGPWRIYEIVERHEDQQCNELRLLVFAFDSASNRAFAKWHCRVSAFAAPGLRVPS